MNDMEPTVLKETDNSTSTYSSADLATLARRVKRELRKQKHSPMPGYDIRIRDLDDGCTIMTFVVTYHAANKIKEHTTAL